MFSLNGVAKGSPEVAKTAEPAQKVAALPPVSVPRVRAKRFRQRADRDVLPPQWRLDRGVLDRRSDPGISWRMGDAGEFRETGFIDTLDPRTRKRMPNPSIELSADAPAATIQVRYVDMSGEMQGPFPIKFDPEAALIAISEKFST